jgi:hypothetical protein
VGNRKRIKNKNPGKPVATSSGLKIVDSLDRKVVSLLNELDKVNDIRISGSEYAEQVSWNDEMKFSFHVLAAQGNHFKSKIVSEIKLFGGNPEAETMKPNPGLSKSWEAIRLALSTGNEGAFIFSCHESETMSIQAYEQILKSGAYIPHNIQEFIHEEILFLKKEFRKIRSGLKKEALVLQER